MKLANFSRTHTPPQNRKQLKKIFFLIVFDFEGVLENEKKFEVGQLHFEVGQLHFEVLATSKNTQYIYFIYTL